MKNYVTSNDYWSIMRWSLWRLWKYM